MQQEQNVVTSVLISPRTSATSATATANLDCIGADYAKISIPIAAEANTNATSPTIRLLESDDTVVTNFATIVADDASVDFTAAICKRYDVDLRGRKRYLRLSITPGTNGTNDNMTFAAVADLTKDISPSTNELADDVTIVA